MSFVLFGFCIIFFEIVGWYWFLISLRCAALFGTFEMGDWAVVLPDVGRLDGWEA